jgi:hypothetical protein
LYDDIAPPPYFVQDFVSALSPTLRDVFEATSQKQFSAILIGPEGSLSALHRDWWNTHAYLAQVRGRKRAAVRYRQGARHGVPRPHAIGEKLGCGAHLETLRRTRIGEFSVSDAATLARFEAFSPGERLAEPHAMPLSRVPFPFPRVQLASLEAWKIRRGQSVPARGVDAREGEWVTLVGPANDMLALGQVNPIGNGGVSLIRPRIVLE